MDIWRQKILAYLHDPAFKPWYLPGHVKRAAEIASAALGEEISEKDLEQDRRPDYIASAAERLNCPWGTWASFTADPCLCHVLSGRRFAVDENGIEDVGADRKSWNVFKAVMKEQDNAPVLQRAIRACEVCVEEYGKGVSSPDHRILFFRLWRKLARDLEQQKYPFGLIWRFMPADTRIPDHSIWDHVRLASAIAGCLTHGDRMAFLLFKVGPVQSFIAESRKARDLWAASYIISVLSGTAMAVIAEELGPDTILYPDLIGCAKADWLLYERLGKVGDMEWLKKLWPDEKKAAWPLTTASLPAVFVALVPSKSAADLAGEAVKEARKAWRDLARGVHDWLNSSSHQSGWDQGWDSQIEGVFDIKYAVLPWPEAPTLLREGRNGVLDTLAALKVRLQAEELPEEIWVESYGKQSTTGPNAGNLYSSMHEALRQRERSRGLVRRFDQHRGDSREKCTLCGRREAMGPVNSRRQLRQFWGELQKRGGNRVVLKPAGAERLCAPCAVKRFVWWAGLEGRLKGFVNINTEHISRFPSTATIAAVPFLQLLAKAITSNKQVRKDAEEHLKAVKAFMESGSCSLPRRPAVACLCPVHDKLDSEVRDIISLDGEFFLPERFEPETVRLEYGDELEDEAKACSEKLANLQKVLQKVGAPARPSSYLGLVTLDGDHVGQWVSGRSAPNLRKIIHPQILEDEKQRERLQKIFKGVDLEEVLNKPRPNCPALQAAISRALRDFSQYAARDAVEGHGMGRLIYAGGDELLAFTPGATALMTAHRLRAYYSGAMRREGEGWAPDLNRVDEPLERPLLLPKDHEAGPLATMGLKATATAAIVLFHALSSLGTAITEGRTAMELAKGFPGENALAISVLKRSGEAIRILVPWRVLRDPGSTADEPPLDCIPGILEPLIKAMAWGELSRNLAYQLEAEAEAVAPRGANRQGFEKWLEWHLDRHWQLRGQTPEISPVVLAGRLCRLACAATAHEESKGPGSYLLDLMGAARFLAGLELREDARND
jgi:CRISPR-associated protein Cmr2